MPPGLFHPSLTSLWVIPLCGHWHSFICSNRYTYFYSRNTHMTTVCTMSWGCKEVEASSLPSRCCQFSGVNISPNNCTNACVMSNSDDVKKERQRRLGGCRTDLVLRGAFPQEWVQVVKAQIPGRGDTTCKDLEGRRSSEHTRYWIEGWCSWSPVNKGEILPDETEKLMMGQGIQPTKPYWPDLRMLDGFINAIGNHWKIF